MLSMNPFLNRFIISFSLDITICDIGGKRKTRHTIRNPSNGHRIFGCFFLSVKHLLLCVIPMGALWLLSPNKTRKNNNFGLYVAVVLGKSIQTTQIIFKDILSNGFSLHQILYHELWNNPKKFIIYIVVGIFQSDFLSFIINRSNQMINCKWNVWKINQIICVCEQNENSEQWTVTWNTWFRCHLWSSWFVWPRCLCIMIFCVFEIIFFFCLFTCHFRYMISLFYKIVYLSLFCYRI